MIPTLDMTVGDVVAADYRTAAVFERHQIDFCCGGKQPLADACRARGTNPAEILAEIADATAGGAQQGTDSSDLGALVSHIVATHHAYVRTATPRLLAYTTKVARVHGERHPEMRRVASLFADVASELMSHMQKEEIVLFPYIEDLARAAGDGAPAPVPPFGTIQNPIRMMEAEHEAAGDGMAEIRTLTASYTPPDDACTTYRVCLQELDAFERDLHTHVHLENNILFPGAVRLESRA